MPEYSKGSFWLHPVYGRVRLDQDVLHTKGQHLYVPVTHENGKEAEMDFNVLVPEPKYVRFHGTTAASIPYNTLESALQGPETRFSVVYRLEPVPYAEQAAATFNNQAESRRMQRLTLQQQIDRLKTELESIPEG